MNNGALVKTPKGVGYYRFVDSDGKIAVSHPAKLNPHLEIKESGHSIILYFDPDDVVEVSGDDIAKTLVRASCGFLPSHRRAVESHGGVKNYRVSLVMFDDPGRPLREWSLTVSSDDKIAGEQIDQFENHVRKHLTFKYSEVSHEKD